jgi:predicted pyridoxine 5'-phosphate oxidase superfamily flavin-nucleotide-binding protein
MSDSQTPIAAKKPSPFHKGEQAMHERAGVREKLAAIGSQLIRSQMPSQHVELFAKLPMILLGSIDAAGQPWASVLSDGSGDGFITAPDAEHLAIHTLPQLSDPLHAILALDAPIGLLGIEPQTRRRNRMNGVVEKLDGNGFTLRVVQSFGNCPKYIQARSPSVVTPSPTPHAPVVHRGTGLDDGMMRMVRAADTYFIASAFVDPNAQPGRERSVDVSHRGGKPGFIRVDDANTLTVPDFIGNFFFNTLGNISEYPQAGLLLIDFETGDLLHLSVEAEIIWDGPQMEQFQGAQRLMRYHVRQALRIEGALPLRWSAPQLSPSLENTGSWQAASASASAS